MGTEQKITELSKLREKAMAGGGAKRIETQHKQGKLTARERVQLLFDPDTFEELDPFALHQCTDLGAEKQKVLGDAVVTGYGKIDGRTAFVFSQDFTVFGGSLSKVASEKICKAMDLAAKNGAPVIGLLDSGGARIQEGVDSLAGYADIFTRKNLYSGVIPQISAVMGPCAGGAVYSPAITDFIFMVKNTGQMYITGPAVIKAVTGEEISFEKLGGAMTHATKSGNCHFVADDDKQCLQIIRRLLSFLPQNNLDDPPFIDTVDDPNRMGEEWRQVRPFLRLLQYPPGYTRRRTRVHAGQRTRIQRHYQARRQVSLCLRRSHRTQDKRNQSKAYRGGFCGHGRQNARGHQN